MSADSGPGNREVARRVFAAEFDDATLSYSESDEERAPNYVVTPTGARINRLFAVGVLTEVEAVNEGSLRGRVVDPTGAFVTYAGQYQPDEHAFLSRASPPAFVALSGKARTFEPEDSDRVFTSVRPESINEVDAATRDRWVVSAAERTLHRVAVFAAAIDAEIRGEELREALVTAGVDPSLAAGIPKAIDHYGTDTAYLEAVRRLAVEATEQVAGERDAVGSLDTAPDDETPIELGALPDVALDLGEAASEAEAAGTDESEAAPTETEASATPTAAEEEPESPEPTDEAEPASEPTDEAEPGEADDLDGGETGGTVQETVESETEELGEFEPEETVDDDEALTESERREVEEEFGAEFSTGSEVGEPGEAGIDVPTSEAELEEIEAEVAEGEEEADEEEAAGGGAEVDLEDAVVDAMAALDEGDGADREAVVERVVETHGVDADVVEDAIQEAMMGGKCYEPGDGTLKAI